MDWVSLGQFQHWIAAPRATMLRAWLFLPLAAAFAPRVRPHRSARAHSLIQVRAEPDSVLFTATAAAAVYLGAYATEGYEVHAL